MTIRPSKRPSELTKIHVKELRANATLPEKILWSALRGRNSAGLKFRKQHPIEPYIADFYCAAAKLIVEVDGESHDTRVAFDCERTKYFQDLGLKVIRVSNDEVINNLEGVIEFVVTIAVNRQLRSSPHS